jgi:hypothetical protein
MKKYIIILIIIFLITAVYADEQDLPSLKRMGLFIGSNNGGLERLMLLYAITDASSMYSVMQEIGGIDSNTSRLLANPDKADVMQSLLDMKSYIEEAKEDARRVEFMFYYSGHSDEEGILLNGEHFLFSELRTAIDDIEADVSIVILDSCASGVFTRIKGGLKLPPFLIDDSSKMEGHAFLTSSSEDEAAQESDNIGASFFTYYLVSGLRGAADTSQDMQVTLNEVYQYAFSETLARTENTQAGPQHPSYNIQLTGTGDLILTDLRSTSAAMIFDEDVEGRIYIRNSQGNLVAEVNKLPSVAIALALPPGEYFITLDNSKALLKTNVTISSGDRVSIGQNDFSIFPLEITTPRGTDEPEQENETGNIGSFIILNETDSIKESIESVKETIRNRMSGQPEDSPPVQEEAEIEETDSETSKIPVIPVIPENSPTNSEIIFKPAGFSFFTTGSKNSGFGYNFQVGIIQSYAAAIKGSQFSLLMNQSGGEVRGTQFALVMNSAHGDVYGHQGSLIFNKIDGNLKGSQTGIIFNKVNGDIRGAQLSAIFNDAGGNINGAQLSGIFNISRGSMNGAQISSIFNNSQSINGSQIALFNNAGIINGTQIGLINKADEMHGGVPIGLINIIGNGQFHGCTWYDGNKVFNFGLKTGTKYFYSLLSFGFQINSDERGFYPGIGFGGELPFERLFIDLDFSLKGFIEYDDNNSPDSMTEKNLYSSIRLLGGVKIFKRLSVFAGGILDIYLLDEDSPVSRIHDGYNWSIDAAIDDHEFRLYPQWTVGLQF